MKKFIAILAAVLAFICHNEIITLLIILAAVTSIAVIILMAWGKTEKQSLPGSFDTEWGKK